MDWTLIVGLVTLALVILSILWGTNIWGRREKTRMRIIGLNYVVNTKPSDPEIQVAWGVEFQRSGAKDIRYIKRITLKPDENIYKKLSGYFMMPERGVIGIDLRLELPRDAIVESLQIEHPLHRLTYKARQGSKDWETAGDIASQLGKKPHAIEIQWEDRGKTTTKTVAPNDYNKWIKI